MTHIGAFETMNDAYPQIVKDIDDYGFESTPRGESCKELRPACFEILNPGKALYQGVSRKLNYRFYAIEFLGYASGLNEPWYVELLLACNGKMAKYALPDGTLSGAYGPLLSDSLNQVIEQLKADPNTRQALAVLWSPTIDRKMINLPCTVSLHFFLNEEGKLDLCTYMRSNDTLWGGPYDWPSFCGLLQLVAKFSGLEVGRYNHVCGSLHLYHDHRPNLSDNEVFDKLMVMPDPKHLQCESFKEFQSHVVQYLKVIYDCWKECGQICGPVSFESHEWYAPLSHMIRKRWAGV